MTQQGIPVMILNVKKKEIQNFIFQTFITIMRSLCGWICVFLYRCKSPKIHLKEKTNNPLLKFLEGALQ